MATGRFLCSVGSSVFLGDFVMNLPNTRILCDHCGYVSEYETKRLGSVGDEGAWICPACSLCNTTYHVTDGYLTVLGYERELEIGFL